MDAPCLTFDENPTMRETVRACDLQERDSSRNLRGWTESHADQLHWKGHAQKVNGSSQIPSGDSEARLVFSKDKPRFAKERSGARCKGFEEDWRVTVPAS